MKFRYTKHAAEKFLKMKRAGFPLTKTLVQRTILSPIKNEDRSDNTHIATILYSDKYVLRVVYRLETSDIIVVITFYPGRRKQYGI